MLLFLDTEYSGLSHAAPDRKLISLALVAEDGSTERYGEVDGWTVDDCSPWVQQNVLPYLTGQNMTRLEAKTSLLTWFKTLPRKVQVACDSDIDWKFLKELLEALPSNLVLERYDLAPLITTISYHTTVVSYFNNGNAEHHALHDARAYRLGWLAWMSATHR